jgi:hypothetical protein
MNGVRSGKAAGCRVIAITTSFPRQRLTELQADYVVDSFAELERLLGFELMQREANPQASFAIKKVATKIALTAVGPGSFWRWSSSLEPADYRAQFCTDVLRFEPLHDRLGLWRI